MQRFWVVPLNNNGEQSADAVPVQKSGYFSPERTRHHVERAFVNGKVRLDGEVYDTIESALSAYDALSAQLD